MQADKGSFVYAMPAFQHSYNSYGSHLPVTTFAVDGHYLGQHAYSPSPMFQLSLGSPGYYPNTLPYGELVPSPYSWDPSVFVGDATYAYGYSGVPDSKSNVSSASHTPTMKFANSNFNNHSEMKSSLPSLDVSSGQGSRNQLKSTSKDVACSPCCDHCFEDERHAIWSLDHLILV